MKGPFDVLRNPRRLALVAVIVLGSAQGATQTALDRYVAAPDASYAYQRINTVSGKGYTTYILQMTSQSWLTTNEVDRTRWTHWMTITKPEKVRHATALLFIGGGSNEKQAPREADANLTRIALATESVVAELRMVPNQPLVFKGDGERRSEDALIAYTWDKYLRTGDERWPARLPMTKSAVRAMDTVTSFCASSEAGQLRVDSFVVAGGSKRAELDLWLPRPGGELPDAHRVGGQRDGLPGAAGQRNDARQSIFGHCAPDTGSGCDRGKHGDRGAHVAVER